MTLTLSRWLDAMRDTDTARVDAAMEFDRVASGDDVASLWLGLPARPTLHPVAITAYRMGRTDILARLAERTIQVDGDLIDREGSWLDTLTAEQLASTVAVQAPFTMRASVWYEPSPLLLGYVAKRRSVDPFEVNWTNPGDMDEELVLIAAESLVDTENPFGDWVLTKSYYRPGHVTRGADLALVVDTDPDTGQPYLPVVVTVQTHEAGAFGPDTRNDIHRLYREDGTYIERVKNLARVYDREGMIAAGGARRSHTIRALTGQISVTATALAIDPEAVMDAVLPYLPVLQDKARAEPVIAALASWPALQTIAEAKLAPWVAPVPE